MSLSTRLTATSNLQPLCTRYSTPPSNCRVQILAIFQLYDDRNPENRSHRGLDQAFLDYFATVDAAAKYAIAFKALASSGRR
jgi:hypothetical protein